MLLNLTTVALCFLEFVEELDIETLAADSSSLETKCFALGFLLYIY